MLAVEADFTPPSEWCPDPAAWHAPDGMATENEVTLLVAGFVRALQPELVVETGAYMGDTTEAIGRALAANGHGRCDSLEHIPDLAVRTARRVEGLPVQVLQSSSLTYTPPGPIGFAWLDSDLDARPFEVERFWPWLADGAIVGVHDTAPHHVTVEQVARLTQGMAALHLRTPRGVTFFQVAK